MKRFIRNCIIFSIFAVLFYIIVMPLWAYVMPKYLAKNVRNCVGCYGHLLSRVRDAEKVKNPDILFLGSSHSYRGFDTRVFAKHHIRAFNLGSSSQTPINTQVLLKQYLDKIKPKMIVYEVYVGTLTENGVESSLDMLSNSYVDKNSFEMAYRINDWLTYNTLLYGFFRTMIGANRSFHEPVDQDGNHYITGGGYVESDFRKNPLNKETMKKWEINSDQLRALKENIAFIKKRKIPYILVQAPITQKLYSARANNKQVDSLLFHLGIYKNFYGSIPLNDTVDFYDSDHMNQDAVVKFNEEFIRYLKSVKIEK